MLIDGEAKRRDDQRLEYIRMTALTEGTPASSRPMSRVARKLAESSEEIPATAGLSLPALQGDACVPPTKALPVVDAETDADA